MRATQPDVDSSRPATKGDLRQLREDIRSDMMRMGDRLCRKIGGIKLDSAVDVKLEMPGLRQDMIDMKEEMIRHFYATANNIADKVQRARARRSPSP